MEPAKSGALGALARIGAVVLGALVLLGIGSHPVTFLAVAVILLAFG